MCVLVSLGHEMHDFVAEWADRVGGATVQGQLFDINGLYPGLKLATTLAMETQRGTSSLGRSSSDVGACMEVLGEVWRMRDFTEERCKIFMEALDEYEDCAAADPEPHPYRRTIAQVSLTSCAT